RQSALEQLVEATRSSSISQKIFAAKNIPHFFHYFPEAEEDAINAVYDLCEDQISQVRMAGYDALVQMSRLEKKWVKRNADVLVQLLQNDDQNEVNLVRKALFQHLQFDAQVTLGVLCDQIVPSDDLSDPEELVMRDHLRSLVLTFIASEVKGKRLLRLMPAEGEAEVALLDGLFSAIPKLSDSAVHIILKDILFQLPFLDKPCSRGSTLSQLVLQNAKRALTDDYSNHDSIRPLNKTRLYFDPLSTLFISKKQGKLDDLIQFYTPMLGKQVLSTITAEDQLELLYHFTETL
ncbi:apoptosis inhibitory protein 5-domain-containing protein, partial [Lentinula raphanica]